MSTKPLMCKGPAGAAFKLRSPQKEDVELTHPQGKVYLRADSSYIEAQLMAAPPVSVLRDDAWNLIQETLDIYSVKNRYHIGTKRGEYEDVRWLQGVGGYEVWFTETLEFKWAMKISMTVVNPDGTEPAPPPPPPFFYHPSFRFYRLSQLTDDLFDSYRNAYLALECIVSDESPKGPSESEPVWLKRVLGGSLNLGVPGGTQIDTTVDDLYQLGRLPLFHAKTGQRFFHPYSLVDREHVRKILRKLLFMVSTLIRFKFGHHFGGGWARKSTELIDAQARETFKVDEVICRNEDDQQSLTPAIQIIDSPRRFNNLWANLSFDGPLKISKITGFTLRNDGKDRIYLDLEEPWITKDITKINLELNHLDSSVNAPKPAHPI